MRAQPRVAALVSHPWGVSVPPGDPLSPHWGGDLLCSGWSQLPSQGHLLGTPLYSRVFLSLFRGSTVTSGGSPLPFRGVLALSSGVPPPFLKVPPSIPPVPFSARRVHAHFRVCPLPTGPSLCPGGPCSLPGAPILSSQRSCSLAEGCVLPSGAPSSLPGGPVFHSRSPRSPAEGNPLRPGRGRGSPAPAGLRRRRGAGAVPVPVPVAGRSGRPERYKAAAAAVPQRGRGSP